MEHIFIILAATISFAVSMVAGFIVIPILRRAKYGQHIREVGPEWHKTKAGTPTMGGIIFIVGILAALAPLLWKTAGKGLGAALSVLFLSLSCGFIGFLDDFVKITKKRNRGLSAVQKLVLQCAVTAVFLGLLRYLEIFKGEFYIPFLNITFVPHWIIAYLFSGFMIVGFINAVNLTDGIDGLATGVTFPVAAFFVFVTVILGQSMFGLALLSAAVAGALLGFLFFNFNPARVFMGDTGSLFLGGIVSGLAFATGIPIVLFVVGFVYLAEALSDIIQVGYFKLTKGKRIFKMAPIHHHFELCGWSEKKIFTVFVSLTILLNIISALGIFKHLVR